MNFSLWLFRQKLNYYNVKRLSVGLIFDTRYRSLEVSEKPVPTNVMYFSKKRNKDFT